MFRNFVEENGSGTGDTISLQGAIGDSLTFFQSFSDGDDVSYGIEDDAGKKVVGVGTYNAGSNTITRNDSWNYNGVVINTSPSNNIQLSTGTHRVICTQFAAQLGVLSTIGQPNGVAQLDGSGKVPLSQLPATVIPSVHVVTDAIARQALTVQEGDEAKQLDDGTSWVYDGTQWQLYETGEGSVFGQDFSLNQSNNITSTTSRGWQNKVTLSVNLAANRQFRLGYKFQMNADTTGTDMMARLLSNGAELWQFRQEPKDSSGSFGNTGTDQRHMISGFDYINTVTTGVHTFSLQFRSNSGSNTSIWGANLELWRTL